MKLEVWNRAGLPQLRNKSAEVKCVALINSLRSRRIITISFSPENGVRFDASCLSPHRVSEFSFDGFQLVLIT